ncbi:uncharacterized protein LOC144710095 [Wolffia australiana]
MSDVVRDIVWSGETERSDWTTWRWITSSFIRMALRMCDLHGQSLTAVAEDRPIPPPAPAAGAVLSALFAAAVSSSAALRRRHAAAPAAAPAADRIAHLKCLARAAAPPAALLRPPLPRRPRLARLLFNTALNAAVSHGGAAAAAPLLDQMRAAGLPPDRATLNILLKLPSPSRAFPRHVIRAMLALGQPPDRTTLATLARTGHARACLARALTAGPTPAGPLSYTPYLQALSRAGRLDEARTAVRAMNPPGPVARNAVLAGLCHRGQPGSAAALLSEPGWRPSVVSFNIVLDGLCRAGEVGRAFQLLPLMEAQKVTPSAVTINILLRCVCRLAGPGEGRRLLSRAHDLGWAVTAPDFNAVMSAFCAAGDHAAPPALLAAMIKTAVKPNPRSFNIVVKSWCRAGRLAKAARALLAGAFKPDAVGFNTVIKALLTRGMVAGAEDLRRRMVEADVEQDLATCTIRMGWLCKGGRIREANLVFGEIKWRFRPDLVAYGVMIGGVLERGDVAWARRLVNEMRGEGLTADVVTMDLVVRGFCRNGFCLDGKICLVLDDLIG